MEKIFQDIANKMTYVPTWVTYIGIFIPILISITVLMSQVLLNKANEKLQKSIHNHQIELKRFDSVLEIYSVFSSSVDVLSYNIDYIKRILYDREALKDWHSRLVEKEKQLYRKYDFALMLLGPENELVKITKDTTEKYCALVESIINKSNDISLINDMTTTEITEICKNYIDNMSYEKFDMYFLKYLNIDNFTEK